ncbi:MAG: hypothetical protein RI909_1250 [Bacteroidota bacterium]
MDIRKSKSLWLLIIFNLSGAVVWSQEKETEYREQTWLGYFNQSRFTNKSGLWIDVHARLTDQFINRTGLSIVRAGYTYYVSDQVRLTSGYAYITQYGVGSSPNVPEHRPWQQVQWFEKKNKFTMMQWFRVEERFRRKVASGALTDDYNFNWRFRYNISFTIPLKGKPGAAKTPFVFLNDEVHINAGKKIGVNYFDQNRLFIGFGYQFTTHLNAQLGYMYVFQQLPEVNKFVHIDAIRLFVFHNLDFRNQE